jgi:hypothetical protein
MAAFSTALKSVSRELGIDRDRAAVLRTSQALMNLWQQGFRTADELRGAFIVQFGSDNDSLG